MLSRIEHDYVIHLRNQVGVVRKAVETFFTSLEEEYGKNDRVLRLYKPIAISNSIHFPMKELHEGLKNTFEPTVDSIVKYSWHKKTGAIADSQLMAVYFREKAKQRIIQ